MREIVCHGGQEIDAARLTGLAESLGGPADLFKGQAPEVTGSGRLLAETAHRVMGTGPGRCSSATGSGWA